MSRPALRLAPAPLSAERQALADAIAEAAPLRAAADTARARAEAARGALASALAAVPAAEREAEAAKLRLLENPHAPRAELRAKRQAAADAVDDLAIAREISQRADAAEVEAERSARYGAERVEAAADAVLAGRFADALAAAEAAGREFARLTFAAGEIASHGDHPSGDRFRMETDVATLNAHFVFRSDGNAAMAARHAAAAPWKAARAALLSDAAAPLPGVS